MHPKRQIALLSILVALGAIAILMFAAAPAACREWGGNWHWKAGGWDDYAISGVPDFDQKQPWMLQSGPPWTYCGPVAAANSLWWFDSKFEPNPVGPIPSGPLPNPPFNDNYYLVASYSPGVDDHDPTNVGGIGLPGLVDDLAWYFDTDDQRPPTLPTHQGTRVRDLFYGLQWYLYGDNQAYPQWFSPWAPRYGSYYDEYHVQMVKMPTWKWVVDEVERSEDVILLLGFWQPGPIGAPEWVRLGGHYVTVAGINAEDLQIAFSDPFTDTAEAGAAGRVLDGLIFSPHQPQPGHPPFLHNDAGNVSHDVYTVTLDVASPAGAWEILGYPFVPACPSDFWEQNVPQEYVGYEGCFEGAPVFVEVEYAIAMSPFYWKPGGEWVHQYYGDEWIWEWWWYEDDGHSCLPDFAWGGGDAFHDGPTAAANSLWWFDSKAETLVTGGFPTPPPAPSDHYPLVGTYDPSGLWDDHDPQNTLLFIDDLASPPYLNTTPAGTPPPNMADGIEHYLADHGVAEDFYAKTQDFPPFEWVADEVETCEDVILLLGFYEHMGGDAWERKGGHWVNAAGVSRDNGLIGLSDPEIDWANVESFFDVVHTGRVFPPEHLDTPFLPHEKQDPQAISHDIYAAAPSAQNPDWWTLREYPVTDVVEAFMGLNGGGFLVYDLGHDFEAVVEWAIGVSPHSDLVITKTAEIVKADPGQEVLIVLEYANKGLAAAENVTITDLLDTDLLTDWRFEADPPISATEGVTYEWTLPKLSFGQGGVITIAVKSDVTWCLSNTATITGQNAIGGPTPDRNPDDNVATILGPEVAWDKLVYVNDELVTEPITIRGYDAITVTDRVWLTYTQGLTFTLVETWSESLELTGWIHDSGLVFTTPNALTWEVADAAPGAWHVLTKTFEARPGAWLTDWITEALDVECIGCEKRVVPLEHPPYRIYLPIVMRDYERAVHVLISGEGEEADFEQAFQPFEQDTGIDVIFEGVNNFEEEIVQRANDGNLPDVALFPQPGLLGDLVAGGHTVDLNDWFTPAYLQGQYEQSWLDMATLHGEMAGAWYRTNVKSLVWYPYPEFQWAGYQIPTSWAELLALSDEMVADGRTPWCLGIEHGPASGWVGTDWVEDIMLRTTTPENYDAWVRGDLAFTSPQVKNAWQIMGDLWFNPNYVLGGRDAISTTFFGDAPLPMFDAPPSCWLHRQANFITNFFPPGAQYGVDYKYFYLPSIDPQYDDPVLMAGDLFGVFHDCTEVRKFVRYVTTGESVRWFVETGGWVSPHKDADPGWYPPESQDYGQYVMDAATVRFDASDLMPGEVGAGSFWEGIVRYVEGDDLDTILADIDASWPP